ncbi:U11/U12 small nuclear ribonucleoprotein 48 kDa protein [Aplysia californica]|uniref:U11/U12 small nuclear ribonucleoprotein 48 kDa protein n=1 Tax=Aplysia californica TaxID=6500 RepID=A0ABM1VXK6_APLCA|nr:U11/U12 small nuclear ribonucleoprotein 48 kDa protein [Aplysia californica]XP_035827149.1 U11/U12 small nuclear ribonucleoprotein 48 kDa protein [Aplysia californica]
MLQGKLPSEVVTKRQQYLNALKRYVEEQEKKLAETLDKLGWTEEELCKIPKKQVCPYNKDHIVPENAFKKHVEKCRLLKAGCQKDELEPLLQDMDFWYSSSDSIMKVDIDESLLNKIIWDHCVQTGQVYTGHRSMPVSHIDANINLTQEDHLAVYRHVVQTSHEAGKVIPIDRSDELLTTDWSSLVKKGLLNEQSNKEFSSKLEQLAALRDMKRRRQSYRAKNVHITKKSYKEIIREVIVNQMEVLKPAEEDEKPSLSRLSEGRDRDRDIREKGGQSSRHGSRDRYRRADRSPLDERRNRSPMTRRSRDRSPYSRHSKRERSRDRHRGDRSRFKEGSYYPDSSRRYNPEGSQQEILSVEGGYLDLQLKQEEVSDDSQDQEYEYKDRSRSSYLGEEEEKKRHKRRKRSRSLSECSESEANEEGSRRDGRGKHKKSKHKKKHSKKQKKKSK